MMRRTALILFGMKPDPRDDHVRLHAGSDAVSAEDRFHAVLSKAVAFALALFCAAIAFGAWHVMVIAFLCMTMLCLLPALGDLHE